MENPSQEKLLVKKETKPADVPNETKYAGFWLRLLAFAIDYFIIIIASKIMFGGRVVNFSGGTIDMNFNGIFILIPILYFILFWKFFDATPGKMILKIKIISPDGKDGLSWKNVLLRYLGYIISALVVFIGFFWIGFDKKKQGWHDKIAKTFVVKK
jgi:uncharacterized RDD family membrane protein YckC